MKQFLIVALVVLLAVGAYFFLTRNPEPIEIVVDDTVIDNAMPVQGEDVDEMIVEEDKTQTVLGTSVEGRDIVAYHFGEGDKELLFIGGIHGGYEWNTALVAYELLDLLRSDDSIVPSGYRVTVIPVLNPDGLNKIVGTTEKFAVNDVTATLAETIPGRFNANNVDLNRNFDCDWQEKGTWQSREVSGGSSAFSEPESQAIRAYVENHDIAGAVVWYSAANGVFTSNCHNGVSEATKSLTKVYADASGYPAYQEFNFYEITGDMVNWFAKERIPAISVLLATHDQVEWDKNQKGILAFLNSFNE